MAWAERTPRWLTRVGAAAAAVLPHHGSFRSLPRRAARFLSAAALPPEERMLRWIGFLPEQGGALLRPGVADGVAQEEVLALSGHRSSTRPASRRWPARSRSTSRPIFPKTCW